MGHTGELINAANPRDRHRMWRVPIVGFSLAAINGHSCKEKGRCRPLDTGVGCTSGLVKKVKGHLSAVGGYNVNE